MAGRRRLPFRTTVESSLGGGCKVVWKNRHTLELEQYAFIDKGTYEDGAETVKAGPCEGKTVKRKIVIAQTVADKIKAGEGEHCRDHGIFYAKTFAREEAFLDELTGASVRTQSVTGKLPNALN